MRNGDKVPISDTGIEVGHDGVLGSVSHITGLKGILASATIVGGSHIWRRSPIQQRRSIRRVLAKTQESLVASPLLRAQAVGPFPRHAPILRLRDMLASPPKGPIVVTGAEGTGTSSVAAAALSQSGTPLLLRLNLRENPPSGGKRPFLRALMSSSGYFTRQREAVDLGILGEGDSEISVQHDVNDFLHRLTEVFKAEKEARDKRMLDELKSLWTGLPSKEWPLPVVFIDEVHTQSYNLQPNEAGSDFRTFLRWALHITSGQLAHVVLVTRPDAIIRIEDSQPEFHLQRQRFVINYPPMAQVRNYLRTEANGDLTKDLIDRITSKVGGQLKNLRLFAHTIQSHRDCGTPKQQHQQNYLTPQHACEMLLEDLISDSNELVLRTWDSLVKDGDNATNRLTSLKRALRFWKMAKVIAEQEALPRQSMVNQVFRPGKGVSASEIEDYVTKGLLTYCSPRKEFASGESSISTASGELWLSAASPLIRGAFAHLTSPQLGPSHLIPLENEILKLELQVRDGQLSRRLTEQSARIRASAELLMARRLGISEELEDVGKVVSTSNAESLDAISELQLVRREYDSLKWKNKWQQ